MENVFMLMHILASSLNQQLSIFSHFVYKISLNTF